MGKILSIAAFEFRQRIRNRAFFYYMIILPIVVIASSLLPLALSGEPQVSVPSVIGILDPSGRYMNDFIHSLDEYRLPDGQPEFIAIKLTGTDKTDAERHILSEDIKGCLILSKDSLVYIARLNPGVSTLQKFERSFNHILTADNLRSLGIELKAGDTLVSSVNIRPYIISHLKAKSHSDSSDETGAEDEAYLYFSAIFFVLLLFMTITLSGGMLVRSIVEEKSNRIIEIILSGCRPKDLLMGKVIGLAALGLFQVFIWMLLGMVLTLTGVLPAGLFDNIWLIVLFFISGYFLYTSIYVGAGSLVNSEQGAQHLTGYLSFILIVPVALSVQILESPDSALASVLSWVPLTSPSVMMLRLKGPQCPDHWEIAGTLLVIVITFLIIMKLAALVFTRAILKFDRKMSIREVFRIKNEEED